MFEGSVASEGFRYVWSESVSLFFARYALALVGGGFGFAVPNINLDASASTHEDLICLLSSDLVCLNVGSM